MSKPQETKETQDVTKEVSSSVSAAIRFWSTHSSYKIVTAGRNIAFKNHVLDLKKDDPDVLVVRSTRSPYIREVLDRPFGKEEELARFNKFLSDLIFTGERGEASKRGVITVRALFHDRECDDMITDGRFDPDRLVMRALKTKSFKEGV